MSDIFKPKRAPQPKQRSINNNNGATVGKPVRVKMSPKPATQQKPVPGGGSGATPHSKTSNPKDFTIQQHVNRITELEKENNGLKAQIVRLERRQRTVKEVAVVMARFASKNNMVKTAQLMDWANKIIRTINGKK